MMGFTMPHPLPPLPKTRAGLRQQHEEAEKRLARGRPQPDSPVIGRPYDWRRDGL